MKRPLAVMFVYAEFLGSALAFVPLLAVARAASARDPGRRVAGRWLRRFGKVTSTLNPLWHFSIEGDPPADIQTRAYVVVSNHESNADPFLLSFLPWDMRWVSKEELFSLPLLGTLMQLGGDVALRRGDGHSVQHMMEECQKTLAEGLSVMIFPEGTRSRDGTLGPFKEGAFRLAIEAGVPVLPIVIAGTPACLPRHGAIPGEARAIAKILAPVQTRGLTATAVAALRDQVRSQIADAQVELRARLRG